MWKYIKPLTAQAKYSYNNVAHYDVHVVSQQTQNIYITFIQRRLKVFDVGPALYKCYRNV